MNDFTHLDEKGRVRMVDVSNKPDTLRSAVARGKIFMSPETFEKIRDRTTRKGNVLETARIAGVMAAKKTADLILLDMIMEPGIDGLETYKRIIDLHPGQKVVIVSGYSETTDVKQVQRLGGGKYVKKPYSLTNIGRAIKEELQKHSS